MSYTFFFFFQAEDGIRDGHVTGVQTCALPISGVLADVARTQLPPDGLTWIALEFESAAAFLRGAATAYEATDAALAALAERSEERRVGTECRAGRRTKKFEVIREKAKQG